MGRLDTTRGRRELEKKEAERKKRIALRFPPIKEPKKSKDNGEKAKS